MRDPVNLHAFVFDLDGTIADNMAIHAEAFTAFTRRHGLAELTLEVRGRLDGKRNRDIFPVLFDRALTADEQRDLAGEKEALYRELSRGRLVPLPGLLRLLDILDAHGLPAAVATSAPAENVTHTLRELGLASRLTRVVRSDEVARGKPHPDVFLAAASRLGVSPESCLVFEDAPVGVVAAHAAGMTCVGITTSFSAAAFVSHEAIPDFAVADFNAFLDGPGAWLRDRRDPSPGA